MLRALHSEYGSWHFPVRFVEAPSVPGPGGVLPDCAFVLGPVEMEIYGSELTPRVAQLAEEMATRSHGLAFSVLSLDVNLGRSYRHDAAHVDQVVGRMFERLLCAGDCPTTRKARFQEICFKCEKRLPLADFAQLCSAIAQARTTEELSLWLNHGGGRANRRLLMWKHLAYAFFSEQSRARSSVSSVLLFDIVMSEADAEAVVAVLAM